MKSNQCIILIAATIIFLMTILSPPYAYEDVVNSNERSAGHHLFNRPPKVKSYEEMKEIFSIPDSEPQHGFSVKIDVLRVIIEWFAILFLMIGGLFLTANKKSALKTAFGILFISVGAFPLGILFFKG